MSTTDKARALLELAKGYPGDQFRTAIASNPTTIQEICEAYLASLECVRGRKACDTELDQCYARIQELEAALKEISENECHQACVEGRSACEACIAKEALAKAGGK